MTQALEDALLWMRYAQEDLLAAQKLVQQPEVVPRQPAWLAQQAGEKAIKAVLIADTIAFPRTPRTHNLHVLHDLIPSGWKVKQVKADLEGLSEYAAEARYPGYEPEITYDDAISAVQDAREIVGAIQHDLDRRLERQ